MTRELLWTASKLLLPRGLRNRLRIAYSSIVSRWKYGTWEFYGCITLEISAYCNRTCSYCPNVANATPREFMSDEVFEMAVRRMREIDYSGIVDFIFYNEPLLDPSLPEKAQRIRQQVPKALLRVTTNGDALTEDRLLTLVREGVLSFYVTRHVPTSEKWDQRMAYLAQKYPQYVTVTDIMEVQKKMGLSNRAGLVEVDRRYTVDVCRVPDSALTIDRFGKVPLCCCDYFRKEVQGDIMRQGILDIWRGENFQKIRRQLKAGIPATPLCNNCILIPKKSGAE